MDVAHCPEMQHDGSGRFIVRGFQDQQAVVVAESPVDLFDLPTEFPDLGFEDCRPLCRVVDVLDTLMSELDRCDKCCHWSFSF